jgi:hypothetical protein
VALSYNIVPPPEENTIITSNTDVCADTFPFTEAQSNTDAQYVSQVLGLYTGDVCAGFFGCYTVEGWTMNPAWTLEKGGTLATKTAIATEPQPPSKPGAADIGTVTATQTWKLITTPCPPPFQLSGPSWARKFPESSSISDLSKPFRNDVTRFVGAMQRAGIAERTLDTLRPPERAYLMHYSWLIAKRQSGSCESSGIRTRARAKRKSTYAGHIRMRLTQSRPPGRWSTHSASTPG